MLCIKLTKLIQLLIMRVVEIPINCCCCCSCGLYYCYLLQRGMSPEIVTFRQKMYKSYMNLPQYPRSVSTTPSLIKTCSELRYFRSTTLASSRDTTCYDSASGPLPGWSMLALGKYLGSLGPFQTPLHSCAEPN